MLDEMTNRYSRSGSAKSLYLDKYDESIIFDVVDTNYLADSIDFHNLIPHVIPLFASNASILYTNTLMNDKDEKHILSSMLCIDNISLMCTFYDIAPTAYISDLTTRAHQQDNPNYCTAEHNIQTMMINRLTWRTITSLDPAAITIPIYGAEEMAKFLTEVFVRMLANRIMNEKIPIYHPPNYTLTNITILLRFLKQRMQVDWEKLMPLFLRELDAQSDSLIMWHELLMYLHLFEIQKSHQIDIINRAQPNSIMEIEVLSRPILPETINLIIIIL